MAQGKFTQEDYDIVKRDILFEGICRLARYHLRFRLFNGQFSDTMTRIVLERKSAAALLPYDPISDQVILIQQFRVGAMSNPESPWLLEAVAGLIDGEEVETPIEVAKREAKEEAGCEILNIYPIMEYFVSPGICTEYLSLFCGQVDLSRYAAGVYGLAHEHEDIRTLILPLEEGYEMVQQGKIKTSPAIIALQWLQLNRAWLKELWQKK